jgi:hypothetical protein
MWADEEFYAAMSKTFKKVWAKKTPEERSAVGQKTWSTRRARGGEDATCKKLSASNTAAWAKKTPEERAAIGAKGAATRRRNAAKKLKKAA